MFAGVRRFEPGATILTVFLAPKIFILDFEEKKNVSFLFETGPEDQNQMSE